MKKRYMVSLLFVFGLSSLAFNVYNKHGKYDATAKENARLLFELENLKRVVGLRTTGSLVAAALSQGMQVDSSSPWQRQTQNADLQSGMQQA